MPHVATVALLCLVLINGAAGSDAPQTQRFSRRWLYMHPGFDLRKDAEADKLIELVERAKKAGFNGVCIKLGGLMAFAVEQPAALYTNIERVKQAAEREQVELIPNVMQVNGYSNTLLSNNPNLAEGIPVRDCVFEVRDGKGTVASRVNLLPLGACEEYSAPDRPDGWDWIDLPGQVIFREREFKHSGEFSVRMEHFDTASDHKNCRLFKKLNLKPWHQYDLTLWIKTDNVTSPENIQVQVHGGVDQRARKNLHRRSLDVQATQDWTEHHAVFNTLDNQEVWLYVGGWNAGGGKIWMDDLSLREVAGINLLRREGCPIRVTSEDGSQVYVEDRDFKRWEYPLMGRVPRPGSYQIAHPEPPLVLTPDSRIRAGARLKVSFYHAQMHMNAGMGVCLSHDEAFKYLEEHLQLMKKLLRPRTYIMVQDEVRLAGWCELCNQPDMTTGEVLARCTRRCIEIIRRVDPGAEIMSWSDMFDPFHNAVDKYWLTRGTMKGTWEGLDRDILVGNWNQGHRKESLEFFAGRGHRQVIATYYDRSNWQKVVRDWLAASEGVGGVDGIMYATWSNDYRHLEEFMRIIAE